MPTSNAGSFPTILTLIEDIDSANHHHLADGDSCYYFGEYTPGGGFGASPTNRLISNFKKGPNVDSLQLRYRDKAIKQVGEALAQGLKGLGQKTAFVPIPPSKSKNHPDYDNRLVEALNYYSKIRPADEGPAIIRELVIQSEDMDSSSKGGVRHSVEELANVYQVEGSLLDGLPPAIIIFDDVLTMGTHFKAMKLVLERALPDTKFFGVFLARTQKTA